MKESRVVLGRPGDLVLRSEQLDEYATRMGGTPAYPRSCAPPDPAFTRCGACGNQMSLVLSVSPTSRVPHQLAAALAHAP